MKKTNFKNLCLGLLAFSSLLLSCRPETHLQVTNSESDLLFTGIPQSWDEGLPLGNAFIGALIWQKEHKLRASLDRIDLWDLHPCDSLSGDNFKYQWGYDCWKSGNYDLVHKKMDDPYDRDAVPSKLPGAALEFDIDDLGEVDYSRLYLQEAVAEVKWKNGASMNSFVDANE